MFPVRPTKSKNIIKVELTSFEGFLPFYIISCKDVEINIYFEYWSNN